MRTLLLLPYLAAPIANTMVAQVQNPGFESGLSGWNLYCPCQAIQFTGDVPPGGGSQSIGVGIVDINCFCSIVETIYQPVPWMVPGQWVLSAWIKNADPGNVPGAAVRLSEGPAYNSTILADAWSSDGVWTYVADTFQITASTDIPALQLSLIPDDGNQMPAGLFAAFDLVQLLPLVSTGLEEIGTRLLEVHPNPACDQLTITTGGQAGLLRILDALGRPVMHVPQVAQRDGQPLDISELPAGQYVVELNTTSGDMVRRRFLKN